jgi:hypothetical protein
LTLVLAQRMRVVDCAIEGVGGLKVILESVCVNSNFFFCDEYVMLM